MLFNIRISVPMTVAGPAPYRNSANLGRHQRETTRATDTEVGACLPHEYMIPGTSESGLSAFGADEVRGGPQSWGSDGAKACAARPYRTGTFSINP